MTDWRRVEGRVAADAGPRQNAEEARIRATYARRVDGAARYALFNPAHLLHIQEIEARVLDLLRCQRLTDLRSTRILEVGCGNGHWLRRMIEWGARPGNLTGVDLLCDRVAEARELSARKMTLICGSAAKLEFPASSFDLVFQSTVFTSILDAQLRAGVAAEMLRVLRADGIIVWFDYFVNNPRNPDVRGIGAAEIRRLFPGCGMRLSRITLAPPLARLLAPHSTVLCSILGKLPLLCTHYLGAIRKTRI